MFLFMLYGSRSTDIRPILSRRYIVHTLRTFLLMLHGAHSTYVRLILSRRYIVHLDGMFKDSA